MPREAGIRDLLIGLCVKGHFNVVNGIEALNTSGLSTSYLRGVGGVFSDAGVSRGGFKNRWNLNTDGNNNKRRSGER